MRGLCSIVLLGAALSGCSQIGFVGDGDNPSTNDGNGQGLNQPDIEFEPGSEMDFGYGPRGCEGVGQPILIKNVGQGPLNVSAVTVVGSGRDAFEVIEDFDGIIAAGESEEVLVAFSPPNSIEYNEVQLQVESNDPDEPKAKLPLKGIGGDDVIYEQVITQSEISDVDVLWVIDNSCSMSDDVADLAAHFDTFISTFTNLGLDYHIGVTTTDMDSGGEKGALLGPVITTDLNAAQAKAEFLSQTGQGSSGSASEQGFDAAHAALTSPMIDSGYNADLLREDASLNVIVVSDEDDNSNSSGGANLSKAGFASFLDGYLGDPDLTSFSGMVGPETGVSCGIFGSGSDATAAPQYVWAIDSTGGVHANMCDLDVQEVLTFLSYEAAGLISHFELDFDPAAGAAGMTVTVDGEEVPRNSVLGWTYDTESGEVVFHGESVPDPGASIIISYPVEGGCP